MRNSYFQENSQKILRKFSENSQKILRKFQENKPQNKSEGLDHKAGRRTASLVTFSKVEIKGHKQSEMSNKNCNPYYLNLKFAHIHLIIVSVIFAHQLDQNIVSD